MSLKEIEFGKTGAEIVAVREGESAGSVIVTKRADTAHIGYLSVKPEYRENGIGSQLLEQAEAWAREKGLSQIRGNLTPVPGSEEAIQNLLKNRGYEIDEKGNVSKIL